MSALSLFTSQWSAQVPVEVLPLLWAQPYTPQRLQTAGKPAQKKQVILVCNDTYLSTEKNISKKNTKHCTLSSVYIDMFMAEECLH